MNTKLIATLGLAATTALAGLNAQKVISGSLTAASPAADLTWGDAPDEAFIVLDGPVFVTGDATLTILPGTIVRGQPRFVAGIPGAPGSLIIANNGVINAEGTAASPIIFTTAAIDNDGNGIPDDADGNGFMDVWTPGAGDTFYDVDPAGSPLGPVAAGPIPGATGTGLDANVQLWGGLVVLGNAPTNLGTVDNATALVGNIEGLTASPLTEYGGTVCNDNSGTLVFLSVRHGGEVLGDANEINGITLGGVGYGTRIEFCEVYMNWDDGFEWFGGTVNGKFLSVAFAGDDHFDGDQGYSGVNQFLFAVAPYFAVGSSGGDEACEFDGTDSDLNTDLNGDPCPFPCYSIANYTFVGPTDATGYDNTIGANGRITLRNDYSGDLYNGFVVNTTGNVFSITTPELVHVLGLTTDDAPLGTIPANVEQFSIIANNGFGLVGEDQAVIGGLDPRRNPGNPPFNLAQGLTGVELPQPFDAAAYTGAFDPAVGTLWTTEWTALNIREILVD